VAIRHHRQQAQAWADNASGISARRARQSGVIGPRTGPRLRQGVRPATHRTDQDSGPRSSRQEAL